MSTLVRAYYISQHDADQDVATRPMLWFVVPTTESGRWDFAVAAWVRLVGKHPSGWEKFRVFAVNVPAPPPLFLPGALPTEQWGLAPPNLKFAPAPMSPPVSYWRVYYVTRHQMGPDDGVSPEPNVTTRSSVWFVVPQTLGPQTDARIRDTPDARHHSDGSRDDLHAITIDRLPAPEPGYGADLAPGPFGSYREWSSTRNDDPFVMPGVN